jgi:hypothetical protein
MNIPVETEYFTQRGFLPVPDPLPAFPRDSPYQILDEWGQELPTWLAARQQANTEL